MRTNYLKFLSLLMMAVLITVASCKKDEDTPAPTLTVTPAGQVVSASPNGMVAYTITSNSSWTATSDQPWCIVTPSGVGNATLSALYDENTTASERTASITVSVAGLNPVVVTLTQGGVNSVSPQNIDIPATPAGTATFVVSATAAWTASSNQPWCTVTSGGTGNGNIEAVYTENSATTQRVASITITIDGVAPITVTLTQAAASAVIEVEGEISGTVNWTADRIYLLKGFVYVIDGATLNIEPGTIIKGDKTTMGSLIVERGGKINAEGTASEPIVFTSNAPVNYRNRGDWGGIIICGKAPVNNGDPQIEGGPRSHYGGSDPDDNSGTLKYVRIEYAGYPFQPDKEVNGLTMGGVGAGTTIEYIMVSFSNDDSYEWFGGTVNCRYLIAHRGLDDDFDTDNGFTGKIQFIVSYRDKTVADVSGSNGFESDNDATGSANAPLTHPIFSNATVIGPRKDGTTSNISSNYKNGMHLRRNTTTSVYNSVFAGHLYGLLLDGTGTQTNAVNGDLQIRNTIIAGCAKNSQFFNVPTTSTMTADSLAGWYLTAGFGNDTLTSNSDLMLQDAWNLAAPNPVPMTGSPLLGTANFTNANLQDPFFVPVSFIGAFGTEDWTSGWANWDPQTTEYEIK